MYANDSADQERRRSAAVLPTCLGPAGGGAHEVVLLVGAFAREGVRLFSFEFDFFFFFFNVSSKPPGVPSDSISSSHPLSVDSTVGYPRSAEDTVHFGIMAPYKVDFLRVHRALRSLAKRRRRKTRPPHINSDFSFFFCRYVQESNQNALQECPVPVLL